MCAYIIETRKKQGCVETGKEEGTEKGRGEWWADQLFSLHNKTTNKSNLRKEGFVCLFVCLFFLKSELNRCMIIPTYKYLLREKHRQRDGDRDLQLTYDINHSR